jgi:DNA-binding beta-propeller fold protein YncE
MKFMITLRCVALIGLATSILNGCADMQGLSQPTANGKKELIIIGIDEKQTFTEKGAAVLSKGGNDSLLVMDIGTNPLNPTIVGTLPLPNTISGPPVNLAITPDQTLALLANSTQVVSEDNKLKQIPDNKLFVVDLTTSPPSLLETLSVGKQPSGMSINRAGTLALVANRADNSISVFRIAGKKVTLIDTVVIGEQVSHVVFTPDGSRALATKFPGHKVALLDVQGEKVTYNKYDVTVGLWPYNMVVAPSGKIAITADNGNSGAADGHIDTVTVIDLEATPARSIDKVVVGDAPEGIAMSPKGDLAVAVLLKGSNSSKDAFFYNRNASVVALKVQGKLVTKSNEVDVRGLPEGVAFSNDGQYIYVGNFMDKDLSILKVVGDQIVNTNVLIPLPGHPASIRGSHQ